MSLPLKMRAWVSGNKGLAGLVWDEVALPRPGKGDLLVRVEAAALNFSDILMINDSYQIRPPRPFTPGQEVAGVVVAAGEGCTTLPGTPVMAKTVWGSFAQYVLVRDDMAMAIPDHVSMLTAAAVPIAYTTALVAIETVGRVIAGEKLLVLAASGGVGLACVEIGAARGAQVIAAAGGEKKCALAQDHGAHHLIDYHDQDWAQQLKAQFSCVDVVADPVGGSLAEAALRLLGWQGRYLIIGFASGIIPAVPANRLLLKRAQALGVYWNHDKDPDMLALIQAQIIRLLANDAIKPHIGRIAAPEQLPQALNDLGARQTYGKVVIQF